MAEASFRLAWPPSDNHYYTVARGRKILSDTGRRYKADAKWEMKAQEVPVNDGPSKYAVYVLCCPPDLRRRDLGNLQKALLDTLGEYGVISDDGDVDKLTLERGVVCRPFGYVEVRVTEIEDVNSDYKRKSA